MDKKYAIYSAKTGLKDCIGKEIKAGDRVVFDNVPPEQAWRPRGVVEFDRNGNMWMVSLDPENEPAELSNHWQPLWPPEQWRIDA